MSEFGGRAGEHQLSPPVQLLQSVCELSSKDDAEDIDRKKESVFRMNPALVVGRESAGGNHAVYVRMQEQVLPPGMQDADEANPGSQAFGIRRYFKHGGSAGAEKQIVQDPGVA